MKRTGIPKHIALMLLAAVVAWHGAAAGEGLEVASREAAPAWEPRNSVLPPSVTERYEYYDIAGNCEHDLQCELKKNGVPWKDGRTYDSLTSWDVKWNFGLESSPDACTAGSFQVFVDILFRYPRWVPPADAPASLVEKWNAYMSSLIIHENGHRDMAVDAAEDLTQAIAALPPASNCGDLKRSVRKLCRQRMKQLQEDAKLYDEATNHGGLQGAVLE